MMLIDLYCPDCLAELVAQGKDAIESMEPITSIVNELHNDGIYTVHCPKGHEGKVVLKNLNFELLFDWGINAIGDGYYRDAVSSFASALERFYEFFIKTVWRINGATFDVIDKNWKELSSQSERQLGAYIAAYCSLFCEVTPVMNNNDKNFRNNVIHKGEIPTRDKVVSFASNVLRLIDEPLGKLQTGYMDKIKDTYDHYSPQLISTDEKENILTINHLTIISATSILEDGDQRQNRNVDNLVDMVMQDRCEKKLRLVDNVDEKCH